MLNVLRSIQLPRLRLLGHTPLSVLAMAAVVMGLLAMHSIGATDATPPGVSVVSAQSAESAKAAVDDAAADVPFATGLSCDANCAQGILDCALMVMGCAMLLTVAALVWFAHRAGMFRALLDAGRQVTVTLRRSAPPHALRPDLVALSISRT